MAYLKWDDFLEQGQELSLGEKVRVNHSSASCDGSSNSMLIERKDNGDISAYCFRCGRSGYYGCYSTPKSSKVGEGHDVTATGIGPDGYKYTIPLGSTADINQWPVYARHWLRKAGITDEEVEQHGILYNSGIDRVILPVYSGDELAFYQTRQVNDTDGKPKYLTYSNFAVSNVISNCDSDTVVLVEDYLSGIKVGRQFDCLVLHGTKILDYHLKTLIDKEYKKFIIWLDDDNLQVKRNTLSNKQLLDKIGQCVVIHTYGKDPKDHSDDEIREFVNSA